MCGRTVNTLSKGAICKSCRYRMNTEDKEPEWMVLSREKTYKPGFNQAPTQYLPVITSKRQFNGESKVKEQVVVPMRWALIPSWAKNVKEFHLSTINCRSEGIKTSKVYRKPFLSGKRCVLVCEGFFEWERDKQEKQPYLIYMNQPDLDYEARQWTLDQDPQEYLVKEENGQLKWKGPRLMYIAGIFDVCKIENDGNPLYSFTVITVPSSITVKPIHDRMPAILETEEDVSKWLDFENVDAEVALSLLKPTDCLWLYPVSKNVNSVRCNDETCVQRLAEKKVKDEGMMMNWLKSKPTNVDQSQQPKKIKLENI